MSSRMYLMKQPKLVIDKVRAPTAGDRRKLESVDQRPRHFSLILEISDQRTMLCTSIMASQDLVVCRRSNSDLAQASSCFSSTLMRLSCTFRSNDWILSNDIPALKVTNHNSIVSVVLVGKRQKPKPSGPCVTWLTSYFACTPSASLSVVIPSPVIHRGSRSSKTVFLRSEER